MNDNLLVDGGGHGRDRAAPADRGPEPRVSEGERDGHARHERRGGRHERQEGGHREKRNENVSGRQGAECRLAV